jgi:voltage-gated potassium channel
MIKKHYNKWNQWIKKHRFKLLLFATLLVLIVPAMSGKGSVQKILFVTAMSFLFIQSLVVASTKKSKWDRLRYIIVVVMIILFVLDPVGLEYKYLDIIRLLMLAVFFIFVTFHLIRFLRKAPAINVNVVITAINIYLLFGIISASMAFFFYLVLPGAYQLPSYISEPNFVSFNYYSFVTMSTVGYGDITPRLPQTQTLAYLVAITGQLYVAIVIAFLVGKLLMHPRDEKSNKSGS